MIEATILEVEHMIDDIIEMLMSELESTGKADADVRLIRNHRDVTLMRLYKAGRKAGLCPAYYIRGDRYLFGGLEREAVKQLVFRFCNEKAESGGRADTVKYRDQYKAIGGNEAYFAKWIVPKPSERPSPLLRSFLKLAVWLRVGVGLDLLPLERVREGVEGGGVAGPPPEGALSEVASSRSISRPIS